MQRKKQQIPRSLPLVVPPVHYCRLTYSDSHVLTSSSGLESKTYRINSLFDPEAATGGQQPNGFDELSALYGKYVVFGARITALFLPSSNDNSAVQFLALRPSLDGSDTPSGLASLLGNPNTAWTVTKGTDGGTNKKITVNVDIANMFGKDFLDDIDASSTTGNPTQPAYCYLWTQTTDGITSAAGKVFIQIEYKCKFYKRRTFEQS